MPFIDSKVTVKMSDDKLETVKSELGKAISVLCDADKIAVVFKHLHALPKGSGRCTPF